MPHTNRKKKNNSTTAPRSNPTILHTKRQQIEDTDGWTHIVDTPQRQRQPSTKHQDQFLHGGDFTLNGVSYINHTIEEVKADHEYYAKQWETSEACRELRERVSGTEGRRKWSNVVCLGLGSFQSARREGRRAAHTQLAALRTIIQDLNTAEVPRCIFQDPQFTDNDKEFLTSLGYTVVEDPLAFSHIDEDTLIYAIHCYAQIYKSISDGRRPAVLIGTDVNNFGKFNLSESMDDAAKGLEDMVRGCEAVEFPQLRHDFSDTRIYWRQEGAVGP